MTPLEWVSKVINPLHDKAHYRSLLVAQGRITATDGGVFRSIKAPFPLPDGVYGTDLKRLPSFDPLLAIGVASKAEGVRNKLLKTPPCAIVAAPSPFHYSVNGLLFLRTRVDPCLSLPAAMTRVYAERGAIGKNVSAVLCGETPHGYFLIAGQP